MLSDFKNAFQRYNNGHIQLIIINVVVFVVLGLMKVIAYVSGFDAAFDTLHNWLATPALFNDFIIQPWSILTYAFMHDLTGILHILFNMIGLYWFGRLFVEYLGSDKLIAVYVLGAIAGAVVYLFAFNLIPYFHMQALQAQAFGGYHMVGASASIYAIVVASAILLPDYTFFLLFFGPVRIKYIAAAFVVISVLGTIGLNAGGNLAHLGGALMGFIYMKQLKAGNNWGSWVTATLTWLANILKEKPKVKVSYRSQEKTSSVKPAKGSNVSQEELDAILDKISAGGYESLTKDEKEKLFNASKK